MLKPEQDGGKFIAAGTYGCVYNPTILCKGELLRNPNKVSKLMKTSEAHNELKEFKLIDKIDPEHKFHLHAPTLCTDLKEPDTLYDNKFKDCQIRKDVRSLKYMSKLDYEHGGDSLSDFFIKHQRVQELSKTEKERLFLELFFGMENMFYGLKKMYEGNFIHLDIKSSNIVVKNVDNKPKFNFIDFGMSMKANEYKKYDDSMYQSMYFAWPLEINFLTRRFKSFLNSKTPLNKRNIKFIMESNYSKSYARSIMKNILSENIYLDILKNVNLDKIYNDYQRSVTELETNIVKKIDVFSYGIVLIDLWHEILGLYFEMDISKPIISRDYKHKETMMLIYNLIKKMVSVYHGDRYNGSECYEVFKQIKQSHLRPTEPRESVTVTEPQPEITDVVEESEAVVPKVKKVKKITRKIKIKIPSKTKSKTSSETESLSLKMSDDMSDMSAMSTILLSEKKLQHNFLKELQKEKEKEDKKLQKEKEKEQREKEKREKQIKLLKAKIVEQRKKEKDIREKEKREKQIKLLKAKILKQRKEGKKIKELNRLTKRKACPPGKTINPKTGRCIDINGKLAIELGLVKLNKATLKQKQQLKAKPKPKTQKVKITKECPKGKILNPKSNRCIKADGKLAIELGLKKVKKPSKQPKNKTVKKPKLVIIKKNKPKVKSSKERKQREQRELLKKMGVKECPKGKILNPKTRRCVKKDGKVARKEDLKNKVRLVIM